MRYNERADAMVAKARVDSTVMIRDRIYLFSALMVALQNEKAKCDNVYI